MSVFVPSVLLLSGKPVLAWLNVTLFFSTESIVKMPSTSPLKRRHALTIRIPGFIGIFAGSTLSVGP